MTGSNFGFVPIASHLLPVCLHRQSEAREANGVICRPSVTWKWPLEAPSKALWCSSGHRFAAHCGGWSGLWHWKVWEVLLSRYCHPFKAASFCKRTSNMLFQIKQACKKKEWIFWTLYMPEICALWDCTRPVGCVLSFLVLGKDHSVLVKICACVSVPWKPTHSTMDLANQALLFMCSMSQEKLLL